MLPFSRWEPFFAPFKKVVGHTVLGIVFNLTEKSVEIVRRVPTLRASSHRRISPDDKGNFRVTVTTRLAKVLDVVEYAETVVDLSPRLRIIDWPVIEDIH